MAAAEDHYKLIIKIKWLFYLSRNLIPAAISIIPRPHPFRLGFYTHTLLFGIPWGSNPRAPTTWLVEDHCNLKLILCHTLPPAAQHLCGQLFHIYQTKNKLYHVMHSWNMRWQLMHVFFLPEIIRTWWPLCVYSRHWTYYWILYRVVIDMGLATGSSSVNELTLFLKYHSSTAQLILVYDNKLAHTTCSQSHT